MEIVHEPIISEELFNCVQHVLTGKRVKYKSYDIKNPDFPLRKFLFHPDGQMLTGCWSKGRYKKYPYYLMHKHKINIRKEVLETAFKNWLNNFKMDITHFEKILSLVKKYLDNGISDKRAEAEQLQKKVVDLKAKQDILIEKNIEDIISNELCKEKIAAIDTELYQIKRFISNLPQRSIDHNHLRGIIRDILRNPGEVWEKADFETKIKLQWFYFPHGIEFNGKKSRTTKICMLFKLKQYISPYHSYGVPHPFSKSNTVIQQISLPSDKDLDLESVEFWQGVGEEIEFLASLTKTSTVHKLPSGKSTIRAA